LPGSYVDVALTLKASGRLILPTNALLISSAGSRVAVIQHDGLVKLKTVTLGTDFGHDIEVNSGVRSSDFVVLNPPDSIMDGQRAAIANKPTKER
jgi:hypothetical protein